MVLLSKIFWPLFGLINIFLGFFSLLFKPSFNTKIVYSGPQNVEEYIWYTSNMFNVPFVSLGILSIMIVFLQLENRQHMQLMLIFICILIGLFLLGLG